MGKTENLTPPIPKNSEPKTEKQNWLEIILITIFGLIALGSLSVGIWSVFGNKDERAPIIAYHSIFVDINGDGKLDYVKYAEVVLNQDANLANPASIYCVQQGGTEKIITTEDGSQNGLCVFPNNTQCDEWEYYRGECIPTPLPVSP